MIILSTPGTCVKPDKLYTVIHRGP